jgi:hypothetical protein
MAKTMVLTRVCDSCGHDEDAHDYQSGACLVGWGKDVVVHPCRCLKFQVLGDDLADLLLRHDNVSRDDKGFIYCTGCDTDLVGNGTMVELWRVHVADEAKKEGLLLPDESKYRNKRLERRRAAMVATNALRIAGADESLIEAAVAAINC